MLRQAAAPAGASPSQLPQEFVFPSGRRCRTYDDLVQGCQAEWEDARDLLHKGDFGRYLARLGRMDLVRAAKEARPRRDPDIALQNFLSSLPGQPGPGTGPRLDLSPRRLMLGSMRAGEQRQVRVTVSNRARAFSRARSASARARSGSRSWAWTASASCRSRRPAIRKWRCASKPRGLPAGQTYSGKLTVVTNGGVAEAPVRLDLAAAPFAQAAVPGGGSARELAERMRANPKPAGPLLESGEVARWFAANGWSYPVAGAPAHGVAAVQQFFECMGLSKPPPLELSQNEFTFPVRGAGDGPRPGDDPHAGPKWVYAQAAGDQPWLRVTTPNVSGPQQTAISFEVDSGLMADGPVQDGLLQITANAGQRFRCASASRCAGRAATGPPAPRGAGAYIARRCSGARTGADDRDAAAGRAAGAARP